MRDVVFTLLMMGLIPAAYRRPLIGMLTFSWLAYMRAQDLCWGFARAQRWSFLFAGLTLSGWLVSQRKGRVIMNGRSWAMIALAVLVGISLLLAPTSAKFATNKYIEFCKIVGVALFTTALVTRKEHLRVLLWVIALSFGFYGLKIGIAGVLSGGGFHVMQGPGGMLEDNNDFALALNMGLPFLAQIGASEHNKVLRRWFYAIVPLQILTVLMTHSRGGLLALIALALVLLWRSKNRVAGFTLLFVAGIISLPLMPEEFFDRMGTIKNYEEDGSALGRLAAWKTAINMAASNPVFGVGLSRFKAAYMQYASGFKHETARATHNAYLQIWAECGTPAFLLYLFLIFATFAALWRLRRKAKEVFNKSWILNYCAMFESSMVAFVVGSTFLSRAQFDLFYHLVAIVMAFEAIAYREIREVQMGSKRSTASAPGRRGAGDVRFLPKAGFGRPRPRSGFRDGTAIGGTA